MQEPYGETIEVVYADGTLFKFDYPSREQFAAQDRLVDSVMESLMSLGMKVGE